VTGTIPSDYRSTSDHITVTFTAYSNITHTTSHTSLVIYVPVTGNTESLAPSRDDGLSDDAHKRLALALGLSFGVIGGLCVLAGIFAIVRRWAKVEDTAIVGEEGRRAWSEKDQRWYGMTLSPDGTSSSTKRTM
jgi:axial budding pattern protein 2